MHPQKTMIFGMVVFFFLLSAGAGPAAGQGLYGQNLVVNGDAESALVAGKIPGWTTTGPFTVVQYGSSGSLSLTDDAPGDRGKSYFGGGTGTALSSASQVIQLPGVEAGTKFYFSGFLGKNYGDQNPKFITLTASFTDGQNPPKVKQDVVLKGPEDAEFDMAGGMVLRTTTGFLLSGITQVTVTVDFATPSGSSANSYVADNISLTLTQEPLTGVNLIVNGDYEDAEGRPVRGWNGSWTASAVKYDGSCYVRASDSGPTDRGRYALCVNSPRKGDTVIYQAVDTANPKTDTLIDSGRVTYQFTGWLGAHNNTPDQIKGRVTFLADAKSTTPLGTAQIGPVTGGAQEGLAEQKAPVLPVPAGTRRILIELICTKLSPVTDNMSVYADNLSLVLIAPDVGVKLISVSNAATGVAGPIAPGEMVTLTVSGLDLTATARMQLDTNGRVSTSLSGVTVTFDGTPAPLLYVGAPQNGGSQIGAIVPFDVDGKSKAPVQVNYKGDKSAPLSVDVAPAVPGIFTQEAPGGGNTAGLIWNASFVLNSSGNPAAKGSVVTIFWTGGGQTIPAGVTGGIEMQSMPQPALPVSVTIDGQTAELLYAGAVPYSWAGLLMAQVRVPDGAGTSGPVAVVITVGNASSPNGAASMWVQ